jgi:hypothetical protein
MLNIILIGGVDTFDHCVSINTYRRKTNRWSFNVLMFLIDAAAQKAYSLFKLQIDERIDMLRARQNQLEKLGTDLIKNQVHDRYMIAFEENFHGRKISFIKKILSTSRNN